MKRHIFRVHLSVLFLLTLLIQTNGKAACAQTSNLQNDIAYTVHYVIDHNDDLTIETVLSDSVQSRFDENLVELSNFGFDNRPYWFRIELNQPVTQDLMLEINQPSLDYVSLYTKSPVDYVWHEQISGHAYSPRTNDYGGIVYAFPIDKSIDNRTIYLRVETIVSMAVPILIKPQSEYQTHQMFRMLLLGVFFGLMVVMATYNFLLYLFLRDKSYLLYVCATLMGLGASLVLNGLGYFLVWPNHPELDQHIYLTFGSLSMVFSSRFAANFLNLKRFDPKVNYYLWAICLASLLLAVLSLFYTATELLWYGRLLIIITFPSYIIIGIRTYLKGYTIALYYVIAWIPYMLGIVVMTMRGAGLIGEHWVTAYGIEFGAALEVVLLSFALAARIKGMRKEIAEKELEKEQFKTVLLEEQKGILEKTVEQRTSELQQANDTKDKFFSIIAHDLRSPMIGLQGVGQKLEYYIKTQKQQKLLEIGGQIDQSIDQLNHLLNNLLNWATSQSGGVPYHPENLNISELVTENIDLYSSMAESKEITIVNNSKRLDVHADINTVATIIRNLLSNAIKFTKVGGHVTIDTSLEKNHVILSIADQGPGIDSESFDQLFKGKLRSKKGSSGENSFGLGLILCKEFAELNNGKISAVNLSGGAIFIVKLPKSTNLSK